MAINIKEFRFGNWFLNPEGKPEQYEDYYMGQINPKTYPNCTDIDGWDETKINPIPITEEWLNKFGFYKDGNEWKNTTANRNINVIPGLNYRVLAQPTIGIRWGELMHTCTHVHLLQNIVYFATGEELKIK